MTYILWHILTGLRFMSESYTSDSDPVYFQPNANKVFNSKCSAPLGLFLLTLSLIMGDILFGYYPEASEMANYESTYLLLGSKFQSLNVWRQLAPLSF